MCNTKKCFPGLLLWLWTLIFFLSFTTSQYYLFQNQYSQPSISTSIDSTNFELKIMGKNCIHSKHTQTFFLSLLPQYNNNLHSIYIGLGIISIQDIIQSMWEDMYRLYANTLSLYTRNLSTCGFNIPRESLDQIPH